jgi:hypothetical protein
VSENKVPDPSLTLAGFIGGTLVLILVLLGWCVRELRRHQSVLQAYDTDTIIETFAVNEQILLELRKDLSGLRDGTTKISHDQENLRSFVEQSHRYSNNRADSVVKEAMGKLNGLYERIDVLEGEVITQQVTRHKLNEMLAARLKDKTSD